MMTTETNVKELLWSSIRKDIMLNFIGITKILLNISVLFLLLVSQDKEFQIFFLALSSIL